MMYPELGEQLKRELMDILACPLCKGELNLKVTKEDEFEIRSGILYCSWCGEYYPIEDGIPNLLPPDIRV